MGTGATEQTVSVRAVDDILSNPLRNVLILFCFFKIYLFYFWPRWEFIVASGLSLVAASGGYSLLRCAASHCGGFSCCGARALGAPASVVVGSCGLRALEHRLSSCGARA